MRRAFLELEPVVYIAFAAAVMIGFAGCVSRPETAEPPLAGQTETTAPAGRPGGREAP